MLCIEGVLKGREGVVEGFSAMSNSPFVNFGEGFKGHDGMASGILDEFGQEITVTHENGWILFERYLEHTKESKVLQILRKWKSDRQLS